MRFNSEKELEDHCYYILRKKGYHVDRQQGIGEDDKELIPDLVTRTTIYELKKVLTRSDLYQAKGQGLTYADILKKKVVIVGQLPEKTPDQESSFKLASRITAPGRLEVSYVELDPFWELAPVSYRPLWYVALLVGAIALAVFAIPLFREEVECRVRPELEACTVDRLYRP